MSLCCNQTGKPNDRDNWSIIHILQSVNQSRKICWHLSTLHPDAAAFDMAIQGEKSHNKVRKLVSYSQGFKQGIHLVY